MILTPQFLVEVAEREKIIYFPCYEVMKILSAKNYKISHHVLENTYDLLRRKFPYKHKPDQYSGIITNKMCPVLLAKLTLEYEMDTKSLPLPLLSDGREYIVPKNIRSKVVLPFSDFHNSMKENWAWNMLAQRPELWSSGNWWVQLDSPTTIPVALLPKVLGSLKSYLATGSSMDIRSGIAEFVPLIWNESHEALIRIAGSGWSDAIPLAILHHILTTKITVPRKVISMALQSREVKRLISMKELFYNYVSPLPESEKIFLWSLYITRMLGEAGESDVINDVITKYKIPIDITECLVIGGAVEKIYPVLSLLRTLPGTICDAQAVSRSCGKRNTSYKQHTGNQVVLQIWEHPNDKAVFRDLYSACLIWILKTVRTCPLKVNEYKGPKGTVSSAIKLKVLEIMSPLIELPPLDKVCDALASKCEHCKTLIASFYNKTR